VAVLAAIAGIALGRSRFPGWLCAIFGAFYGAFFIPWQIGLAFFADQNWNQRLHDLAGRLGFAMKQFFTGENVEDPLLFLFVMAIFFWILGINSGFRLLRRGDLWGALIPLGGAALIIQAYDSRALARASLLAVFLFLFLLLLARVRLLKERSRWEIVRLTVPQEISGRFSSLALLLALCLVIFAWATPALASSLDSVESLWSTLTSPWRVVTEELGRAVFPLQGELFRTTNSFGENFLLGRGAPQSPEIVFTVRIIQQDQIPIRYYWRDRVYDRYEGGRWSSSYEDLELWSELDPSLDELAGRSAAEFVFTAQQSTVLLHTAPQAVALNRASKFTYAANEDGSQDAAAFFAQSPVLVGESYDIEASLAVPTANQLNEAGDIYPDWVSDRYLQLPEDFSEKIRNLAFSVTENLSTPYEKTVAITNFLRAEIEYVDRVSIAPFDRDPIEWILFDQKEGFCNYYATAEVLMLRSLGIPARLAVGYSQGEQEGFGGGTQYIVRARDAHAWPEVYFPAIGWVEFEPTASQHPLIRPLINPVAADELEHPIRPEDVVPIPQIETTPEETNVDESLTREDTPNLFPSFVLASTLLLVGIFFAWKGYRDRGGMAFVAIVERGLEKFDIQPPHTLKRLARLSEETALTRAFMQINYALGWLGVVPKPGDTPEQRANALAARLPTLGDEIRDLARNYELPLYSRSRVIRGEDALETARRITWLARREQLTLYFSDLLKPLRPH
jgi:transglutaminase-like putative cysteine protease